MMKRVGWQGQGIPLRNLMVLCLSQTSLGHLQVTMVLTSATLSPPDSTGSLAQVRGSPGRGAVRGAE